MPDIEIDPAPSDVPVNVWLTEHAIVVVAPMPGVTSDDVVVELRDGELHLDATPKPREHPRHLVTEWQPGPYHRVVRLGPGVGRPVIASVANGVVGIRVARTRAA